MAYIGRGTDKLSNIEKLDTITFDGSSSYTLQKNSVNFTPNSANSLQVSIDGVVQAGNFTVSGSTIDFGVAIPSTSTNDFIFHYGTGLVTTVADGAITTAKLGDASVTSAKLSGVTQGITMADQWRLTAITNESTDADVTANWERVDNSGWSGIGTGLTESSGIFSFPQTGIYLITMCFLVRSASGDTSTNIELKITEDNSTYNTAVQTRSSSAGTNFEHNMSVGHFLFDVTNTTNYKFKFTTSTFSTGSHLKGDTSLTQSGFTVLRIGDT